MKMKLGLLAALLIAAPVASHAAGGAESTPVQACKEGMVWDKEKKECVAPKQGRIGDDSLFEEGRRLAYAGRYEDAISVLNLASSQEDPRILNFLGYSNRKLGRLLIGLGYYEEALRIDPNYVLVREYLGEAHLQMGDVASAKEQLGEIEKRAGKASEEYVALAGHIADYETKGG